MAVDARSFLGRLCCVAGAARGSRLVSRAVRFKQSVALPGKLRLVLSAAPRLRPGGYPGVAGRPLLLRHRIGIRDCEAESDGVDVARTCGLCNLQYSSRAGCSCLDRSLAGAKTNTRNSQRIVLIADVEHAASQSGSAPSSPSWAERIEPQCVPAETRA